MAEPHRRFNVSDFYADEASLSGSGHSEIDEPDAPTKDDIDFIDDSTQDNDVSGHQRLAAAQEIERPQLVRTKNNGGHLHIDTPVTKDKPIDVDAVGVCKRTGGIRDGKFRIRGQQLFITYPQCPIEHPIMLQYLETIVIDYEVELIVVAKERHLDNQPHLHAFIKCKKPITGNEKKFDINWQNTTYHPNIQTVRNKIAVLKYVIKDGNYVCLPANTDVNEIIEGNVKHKAPSISTIVAQQIIDGKSISTVTWENPGYALQNLNKIKMFAAFAEKQKEIAENNVKRNEIDHFSGNSFNNMRIAGWLNDNVIGKHKMRQLQLWIYGKTKIGKTTLIEWLKHDCGFNIADIMYDANGFFDGIDDDTIMLCFDEFHAQLSITQMNKLTDGSTPTLNVKGGYYKVKRPLAVIVLSNFSIAECYSKVAQEKPDHLETLKGRFIELNMGEEKIEITSVKKNNVEPVQDVD